MRGHRRVAIALLALVAVATPLWHSWPALSLTIALAAPSAAPLLRGWSGAVTREEITVPTGSGRLAADLYRPRRPRGSLLLVHGLSAAGRRQPDLARLASLLAERGSLVLVPEFDGLAAFRLTGREVADVRAALDHAARLATGTLTRSTGVAGFSFGAGPVLLAAADTPGLRVVGSFGGYADLRHVIAFVTTGVSSFDGQRHVQRQEEYNRWKLLAMLAGLVSGEHDGGLLGAIAKRKLANPGDDTHDLEHALGARGQSTLALVTNTREDAVDDLLARLPESARDAMRVLSPLAAIPRIRARLLIGHGTADQSIPFTESLRLAAASGHAHLALFATFHHTGPQTFWTSLWNGAGDGWKLTRLIDELLPG